MALPIGTALFLEAEPARSKHQTLCLPDDEAEARWKRIDAHLETIARYSAKRGRPPQCDRCGGTVLDFRLIDARVICHRCLAHEEKEK